MAKERTKKKRDGAVDQAPATAAAAPYNGSEVPTWARWPHARPETYYGAPAPYSAYDWSHPWPSHMRSGAAAGSSDSNFPGEFGTFPRTGGYPFPPAAAAMPQHPVPPPPPSATPPPPPPSAAAATTNSPPRASPHSSNLRSDSASEGSSFSDGETTPQDQAEDAASKQQHRRKRKVSEKKTGEFSASRSKDGAAGRGKSSAGAGDDTTAKNKKSRIWFASGRSSRPSLRRCRRTSARRCASAATRGGSGRENKELEHPEQLVFSDDTLQEIHTRLNSRPKGTLRSRFQSGVGGARGCLGDDTAREVASKRMKKTANNQLLVDSIVEKVVENVGTFDDTASAQGFKEVLDAVVNLTSVLLAETSCSPQDKDDFHQARKKKKRKKKNKKQKEKNEKKGKKKR